ncbi:TIGR03757 family integrating conjugative element protein [Corticibacter populi]|nr:TIGR03757 family integrating conjugative element protein [Corticibacter populi]
MLLLALAAGAGTGAHAQIIASSQARYQGITHVEVFANSAMPIRAGQAAQRTQLQIFRVDDVQLIEEEINVGVPASEAAAMAHLQRQEAAIRRKYQARIQQASTGMSRAIAYRLSRIPAVVINQKFVLYGITDIDAAADLFQQRQANLQGDGQ